MQMVLAWSLNPTFEVRKLASLYLEINTSLAQSSFHLVPHRTSLLGSLCPANTRLRYYHWIACFDHTSGRLGLTTMLGLLSSGLLRCNAYTAVKNLDAVSNCML